MRVLPVSQVLFLLSITLSSSSAWIPSSYNHLNRRMPSSSQTSLSDKAPMAGTFFNEVPDDNNDKEDEAELTDRFEQLEEMIKQRKKPPLASQPSTINGVPTKQASGQGFGAVKKAPTAKKIAPKDGNSKPFVGIGPSSLNDVTKPEYDDQGYTLYADEKTGEKSRVFEALVDYPCDFTMKIVGDGSDGTFVVDILSIVAESCEVTTGPDGIQHSIRKKGKWTSVTVKAPVQSAEMLYSLYESVDRDPRVKFKF